MRSWHRALLSCTKLMLHDYLSDATAHHASGEHEDFLGLHWRTVLIEQWYRVGYMPIFIQLALPVLK